MTVFPVPVAATRRLRCRPSSRAAVSSSSTGFWKSLGSISTSKSSLESLRASGERARPSRVRLPPVLNTPYCNTIPLAEQPQYPGNLDIECAPAPLIDRLNSNGGDRPLSAHPIDVAM